MKVALALGGGSVRGFAHLGVLKALREQQIKFDFIVGTSAGGIIGTLYAFKKDIDECYQILDEAVHSDVVKGMKLHDYKLAQTGEKEDEGRVRRFLNTVRGAMLIRKSLSHRSMVNELNIEEFFELIYPRGLTFDNLSIPVYVVALDLISGKDVVIGSGDVVKAVRATSAIPGLLPPVELNGMLLVDGGTTQKVPVESAYLLGADVVIAVDVGRDPSPEDPLDSGLEIMWRSEDWSNYRLHLKQLSMADVVLKPQISHIEWYDTDAAEFLFKEGYEETLKKIDEIKKATSPSLFRKLFGRKKKFYREPLGKYVILK